MSLLFEGAVDDALHDKGWAWSEVPCRGFAPALIELDDDLVDGQALAGFGDDALDLAVLLGLQDVLHLHRLDDRRFFTGADRVVKVGDAFLILKLPN